MQPKQLIFCFDDSEMLPSDVVLVIAPRSYFERHNVISDDFGEENCEFPSWIHELNGWSYFEVYLDDSALPENIQTKEDIKNELTRLGFTYSESLSKFINDGEDWNVDNVQVITEDEVEDTRDSLDQRSIQANPNNQVETKEEPRKKKFWE